MLHAPTSAGMAPPSERPSALVSARFLLCRGAQRGAEGLTAGAAAAAAASLSPGSVPCARVRYVCCLRAGCPARRPARLGYRWLLPCTADESVCSLKQHCLHCTWKICITLRSSAVKFEWQQGMQNQTWRVCQLAPSPPKTLRACPPAPKIPQPAHQPAAPAPAATDRRSPGRAGCTGGAPAGATWRCRGPTQRPAPAAPLRRTKC
jgi:hypothetical protein